MFENVDEFLVIFCSTLYDIYKVVEASILVRYWFSEDFLTQSNPFCTYIISSNQINRAHSDNIIINNGHCSHRGNFVADVSAMMSLELRRHCIPILLFFA